MGEVKCCYFPVIKQFSLLLALRFFCLEVSVMALFCSLTFVIFIQNCGIWLQKQKEEGLICVGNLTVAKYVKLVYIWSQNDRVFWHWKTYGSSFERCKNSCNILLSMAVVFFGFFLCINSSSEAYSHLGWSMMITVCWYLLFVNVVLQKTSFWMYHREKHAAFQESMET